MTIASRFYAGIAAIALVLAGLTAFAPTQARAQGRETSTAILIGGVLTVVVVTALVLAGNDDDNDTPTSP